MDKEDGCVVSHSVSPGYPVWTSDSHWNYGRKLIEVGGRHHLRMHLKSTERANESFPLEPYIQTPDKGFMTSGMEAGTLVIPSHPNHLGIPWLKGMSSCSQSRLEKAFTDG